jgi:hypothetical protein
MARANQRRTLRYVGLLHLACVPTSSKGNAALCAELSCSLSVAVVSLLHVPFTLACHQQFEIICKSEVVMRNSENTDILNCHMCCCCCLLNSFRSWQQMQAGTEKMIALKYGRTCRTQLTTGSSKFHSALQEQLHYPVVFALAHVSKSRALHCITVFAERVIHCRIENLCNEHTVLVREALY